MRCKKHITDHSSTVGVCATCLRERLFILAAAQAHQDQPKSASPYTSRHNSVNGAVKSHFFHTPQIDLSKKHHRTRSGGFSLFSNLFGSKSGSNPGPNRVYSNRGMSPVRVSDSPDSSRIQIGSSKTGLLRNVSVSGLGFGFCLSPIVRPSPSRQRRAPTEPELMTCRSRKLCDLGRFNRNR